MSVTNSIRGLSHIPRPHDAECCWPATAQSEITSRSQHPVRTSLIGRDEARRIAANIAKLPLNIDQTAKSKSNAHDKGGTNEDSSRRNGACEFPTRCLFGPTRTAGSGGTARRKRSKRRSGSARPDRSKRRSGSARPDRSKRRSGSARAGGFRRQRRPTDRERRKNSQLQ
jgi:hypothetical protein